MISSEVQRTLVKSPPELWAEISDPESLARHLGEFGEIRITRVQPEKEVAWEAAEASGTVAIKPSGWGTKVRLTVTRELAELAGSAVEPGAHDADGEHSSAEEPAEHGQATGAVAEPDGAAAEPEPEPEAVHEAPSPSDLEPSPQGSVEEVEGAPVEPEAAAPEQELAVEGEPVREQPLEEPSPEPKRGLFARLFGFRRARRAVALASELGSTQAERAHLSEDLEPEEQDEPPMAESSAPAGPVEDEEPIASDEPASVDEAPSEAPAIAAPGPQPGSEISADADGDSEPADEPAAQPESARSPAAAAALAEEIREAEEVAQEQVTAVLTGVLDRLGAAHHRPFSRA